MSFDRIERARIMGGIAPSICAGHSVLCPYKAVSAGWHTRGRNPLDGGHICYMIEAGVRSGLGWAC